ncbi:MAG: DUF411 domain-containing protein [Gammaproteobacteria bacterium]|nr:DUF411 domain-containing protein [Gammaproteobacteria bacterium]
MAAIARLMTTLVALCATVAGAEPGFWDQPTEALSAPVEIVVYRSPSCGCCGKWLDHVRRHGFAVQDIKGDDMDALKRRLGIPEKLKSCHTGIVGGYLIEGHVPAADIKRLLRTRPDLAGISVPGMPVGPPGMEMGSRKDPFTVLGFAKDGRTSVFTDYTSY